MDGSFGVVVDGVDKVAWSGVTTETKYGILHIVDVEEEDDISTGWSGDARAHQGVQGIGMVHFSGVLVAQMARDARVELVLYHRHRNAKAVRWSFGGDEYGDLRSHCDSCSL